MTFLGTRMKNGGLPPSFGQTTYDLGTGYEEGSYRVVFGSEQVADQSRYKLVVRVVRGV